MADTMLKHDLMSGHTTDPELLKVAQSQRGWAEPRGARRIGRYALLASIAFLVLFPVYTTIVAAFKPGDQVIDRPLVPNAFTLDVIREAWTSGRLGRYLWNSFLVAAVITLAQVITSLLSGYAFAYLRFPGRNVVFLIFLATLLVPLEATVVVNLDTVGTAFPDWLPFVGGGQPFGGANSYRGLMVPFLATGHLGFIRHVAVPLVRPMLAALALFSFLSSWNQYLWPSLLVTNDDQHTVQSGLRLLSKSNLDAPNLVMAGTIIAAIPILVVLVVFQKHLVRGLTTGAVKG
jgi:sn-glycerol 3-phosphate transport system permease protein